MGGKWDKEYEIGDSGDCGSCKGTGRVKKFFGGSRECYDCRGTGIKDGVVQTKWDMDDELSGKSDCDHYWGPGSSDMKTCRKCGAREYR